MCALLWDAYKTQSLRELVGEGDGDYLKEGREELKNYLRLCENGNASMVIKHP
jgi:hypothetical protein